MTRSVLIIGCLLLSHTESRTQFEQIELGEPLLRIGSEASGHLFSNIIDWAWDSEGNLYILDPREHTISVFNASGEYKFSFGGFGSGPGEFRGANDIEIADSSLYLLDYNLSRISEFNLSGEYQDSASIPTRANRMAIANESLYVLTPHSTSLVLRTPLTDLEQWEVFLSRDDVPHLQSHDQPWLCQPFYIGILANELHLTFPGILKMIFWSNGKQHRIIEPESELLEARLQYLVRRNGDWRNPSDSNIRSIPGVIGPFTQCYNNKLLMGIGEVIDDELSGVIIGIVLDPANGQEIGPRLYIRERGCRDMRFMPPDQIGVINTQLATLDIYRLPSPRP